MADSGDKNRTMTWEWSDFYLGVPRDLLALGWKPDFQRAQEAIEAEFLFASTGHPVSFLLQMLIDRAKRLHAREIVLNTCEHRVETYYRVDDSLVHCNGFPLGLLQGVIDNLKGLCEQKPEVPTLYGEFWLATLDSKTKIHVTAISDDEKILLQLTYEK